MTRISDISDKGRKQGKLLRYEVGIYVTTGDNETPEIVAKFKRHGDACIFANHLAQTPDPTLVLIRS